jgi:hypothetical protein
MRKDQSVLSARKAAFRMGLTECIERAASPQALLSLSRDGIYYELVSPRHDLEAGKQSYGRGDPGQPCHVRRTFGATVAFKDAGVVNRHT